MTKLQQLKQQFTETDSDYWSIFRDPPVWANTEDEFSIRVAKPFSEDNLHPAANSTLGEVFGMEDRGLGNIRVERRGVPFYEADYVVVGHRDERRFFPHGVVQSGASMNDFQAHIGRVMTESLGYRDYDEVLQTVEDADKLGD